MEPQKRYPAASGKGSQLCAFGRVFAGKLSTGMKVRVMVPGEPEQQNVNVQRALIWMGQRYATVEDVPCGNTVAMVIDKCICVNATLTNEIEVDANPIIAIRSHVTPMVRVAVECSIQSPKQNAKLRDGLKLLKKVDPMVHFDTDGETRELIVSGIGDLHLEVSLKYLKDNCMEGDEIICRVPKFSFRETVTKTSSNPGIIRSFNPHFRLNVEARPLEEGLVKAIEAGDIGPRVNQAVFTRVLVEEFGWESDRAQKDKIWFFGPDPNMVVDMCKGVSLKNLPNIQRCIKEGFEEGMKRGVLSQEKMRGICFILRDSQACKMRDNLDDKGKQTAKSAILAAQRSAEPRLMEPVYLVVIQAPIYAFNEINKIIIMRGGCVSEMLEVATSGIFTVSLFMPARRSIGFVSEMRGVTSGEAFPVACQINHWKPVA